MERAKNTKHEVGILPDKKNNRYWQIKLGKIRWFSIINRHKGLRIVFNLIKRIIGLIVFFLLLIPISIIASVISFAAGKKIKKAKYDKEAKNALGAYGRFIDIYPARVYSPLSKSLEVGLLEAYELKPPSLEIGIGDGYLSSLIFEKQKQKLTIGGDMIYETILSAKKYNHIDKLAVFDAEEIPLPDNCLNTVIMINLMHHLPSRERILKEIERVLRLGGQFIFTDNLYGWVKYTFDSRLLRFFRLNFIARKLEAFKLKLFAQKLLISSTYWEEIVKNSQMEVLANREFVSRKAMTISSLFEYLNLLQGQPTRESMKLLLKIGCLKRFIDKKFENIIRYLIINENDLLRDDDGAFLFVVLRKKQDKKANVVINKPNYICLKCRNNLISRDSNLVCKKCGQIHVVRRDIPIILRYQDELANFNDYLETSDKKKSRDYIT